jgi:MSHA biogenesis protein MshJ
MNTHLITAIDYLNKLSLREKLLSLVVFIALIYAVWDIFFFANLDKRQQKTQAEQQDVQQQQQALNTAILQLQKQLKNVTDPNEKTRLAINTTNQQLSERQQQLDEKIDTLVEPSNITDLLRSLLLQSTGLILVSLKNEAVTTIVVNSSSNSQKQKKTDAKIQFYQHAATIKFRGHYQQLYDYLTALEDSPWGLYWDQLEYVVSTYPNAEISLRVHTISTDEHWIGL